MRFSAHKTWWGKAWERRIAQPAPTLGRVTMEFFAVYALHFAGSFVLVRLPLLEAIFSPVPAGRFALLIAWGFFALRLFALMFAPGWFLARLWILLTRERPDQKW